MTPEDLDELRRAKTLIERHSFGMRVSSLIGSPIERGFQLLPPDWAAMVADGTRRALQKALDVALATIDNRRGGPPSNAIHKLAVIATGAGAGALGLAALVLELPVSTTVMLRSIADIARSQGEHIDTVEAQLACLEVFALGGATHVDAAAETGYFAVRVALARTVSEAAELIAERGVAQEGAPAIVRLIAEIASRFGAVVSEKAAAQAVPVIGAVGGAIVNLLFMNHFQDVARGHFTVRRIERLYGADVVRTAYDAI